MNLREMIARVEDKTRHNPKVATAREIVARDLSEAHRELMTDFEWPFMRRTAPFWQFPDGVFEAVVHEVSPSTGIRIGTLTTQTSAWEVFNGAALDDDYANLTGDMLDGEVELYQRGTQTFTGTQNWQDGPFAIEHLAPSIIGGGAWLAYLDPRFIPNATASGTTVNVRVVWRRRQAPADCMWPKWVNGEDGRVIPVVSTAEAASFYAQGSTVPGLDIRERTGTVQCFVLDDGADQRMPYPGRDLQTTIAGNDENQYSTLHRRDYGARIHPPPVHQTITAAWTATGSGTLVNSKTYRVFVSWFVAGRFGPRSEIVTVPIGNGAEDALALSNLPSYPTGHHANGRRLSVWLSDQVAERGFVLAGFVLDEQDTSVDVEHDPRAQPAVPADSATFQYADHLLRWDDEYPGRYTFLRPWPRPTAIERHTLTYIARPRQLLEPMDEPDPQWAPFHDVLVYKVLHDLCLSFGARTSARTWKAQLDHRMRRLKARFKPAQRSRNVGITPLVTGSRFPNGVDYQG